MTPCACLVSFMLITGSGYGSIDNRSISWTPESCHTPFRQARTPFPSIMLQKPNRHFTEDRLAFLRLPDPRLNGTWLYVYCFGEARVKINGQWEQVFLETKPRH